MPLLEPRTPFCNDPAGDFAFVSPEANEWPLIRILLSCRSWWGLPGQCASLEINKKWWISCQERKLANYLSKRHHQNIWIELHWRSCTPEKSHGNFQLQKNAIFNRLSSFLTKYLRISSKLLRFKAFPGPLELILHYFSELITNFQRITAFISFSIRVISCPSA